jgi:hypothetical protein
MLPLGRENALKSRLFNGETRIKAFNLLTKFHVTWSR